MTAAQRAYLDQQRFVETDLEQILESMIAERIRERVLMGQPLISAEWLKARGLGRQPNTFRW